MTRIDTAAARLIVLVKLAFRDPTIDRTAVTQAAVALMDTTARAGDSDDDETLAELADDLAEQAALWSYLGFDRPEADLCLLNALRSYELAALAIAADKP